MEHITIASVTRVVVGCIAAVLAAFVAYYALALIIMIIATLIWIIGIVACAGAAYVYSGRLVSGTESVGTMAASAGAKVSSLFASAKARFAV